MMLQLNWSSPVVACLWNETSSIFMFSCPYFLWFVFPVSLCCAFHWHRISTRKHEHHRDKKLNFESALNWTWHNPIFTSEVIPTQWSDLVRQPISNDFDVFKCTKPTWFLITFHSNVYFTQPPSWQINQENWD